MKNKEIISAVVGASFFAIPYVGLSVTLAPSLVVGSVAFVASELILSGFKKEDDLSEIDRPLYLKITEAKKQNKEILALIPKVESEEVRKSLNDIHSTVNKIINVIEKDYKKANKTDNFFDYYLPILVKIVNRYDEIENQDLISKDGKNFIKKADKMIKDTSESFKLILSSLYQGDLMDADAEMKVYDLMLKADGLTENSILGKGSDLSE